MYPVDPLKAVQEKLDTGLSTEADARRKTNASFRSQLYEELETAKRELVAKIELEASEMQQAAAALREEMFQDQRSESKSRQVQLSRNFRNGSHEREAVQPASWARDIVAGCGRVDGSSPVV